MNEKFIYVIMIDTQDKHSRPELVTTYLEYAREVFAYHRRLLENDEIATRITLLAYTQEDCETHLVLEESCSMAWALL